MSVTYKNAPLVELIAELRWGDPIPRLPLGGPQVMINISPVPIAPREDELYTQFGSIAASEGYGRSERIVPMGFSPMPFQLVYRYRPTDPSKVSPLYQIGNGIFSTNALPPYKSWLDFQPHLEKGLEILEKAMTATGNSLPNFNMANVRYIDAFKEDLTGGRSPVEFMSEILGLNIIVPESVREVCSAPFEIKAQIHFTIPTHIGQLTMVFGQAVIENQQAVIMDSTLTVIKEIGSDIRSAVNTLVEARGIIHNIFRGMTGKLHAAMEPVQ